MFLHHEGIIILFNKIMVINSIISLSNVLFMLLLSLFNFRSVHCFGKNFSSQKLCQNDGDCSFQVGDTSKVCHVYNTSESKEFDFDRWTKLSTKYPPFEEEANFQISVLPYEGKYVPQQIHNVLAINISLRSFTKEINGYYIEVSELPFTSKDMHRIFDFRQAARVKRKKFSLYYDCLHTLDENGIYTFMVIARALPINEELRYMMYLPDTSSIKPSEACQWKPLILVFLASLEANTVSVQFSKAPLFYDIRQYEVSLIFEPEDRNDIVIDTKLLELESERDMMHVKFENIDIGCYHVHIALQTWKDNCNNVHSNAFCVTSERSDLSIGYAVGLSLLGVILIIGITIMTRWISAFKGKSSKPTVLLVYPYVPCHVAVMYSFKWVLQYFHWGVSLIYGEGDVGEWLYKHYEDSTAILLMCSRIPPDSASFPRHPWADRFQPTLEFLNCKIFGDCSFHTDKKKLAKVHFSYSDLQETQKLKSFGKKFEFPKDIDKLLLYLSGLKPRFPCFSFYRSSSKDINSFCEGQELTMRIRHAEEAMQNTLNASCQKSDCRICRNEDVYQHKFLFHSCSVCEGYPLKKPGILIHDSSV